MVMAMDGIGFGIGDGDMDFTGVAIVPFRVTTLV